MTSEQNAKRDAEQDRLIQASRQLRDQLATAVTELDRYVQALQVEIDRLQKG